MTTQSSRTITPTGVPAPRRHQHTAGPAGPADPATAATAAAAARTAARLVALRTRLERTDLRPGGDVDAAFTELVELCCHPPAGCSAQVLHRLGAHAGPLRALGAAGEGLMEQYWARRIVAAPDPVAELDHFPYLGNYHDLVRLELAALTAAGLPVPRRAVVLGSGPLPLTGLELARRHGVEVVHVDRDTGAAREGDAVATALGIDARTVCADAGADRMAPELQEALAGADLVLVGALVGADAAAKDAITRRIAAAAPDATQLVRSAAGLRTLLYPEVVAADLTGLEVLVEVHPHTDVVNSVLVARPPT